MFRPTIRCILLHVAVLPLAVLPWIWGANLWPIWLAAVCTLWMATMLDGILTPAGANVSVAVGTPPLLYIGQANQTLVVNVSAASPRPVAVDVLVQFSPLLEPASPFSVVAPPGARVASVLAVVPRRRGTARIESVWLRWHGPLRLAQRAQRRLFPNARLPIVSNVAHVRHAALRFHQDRQYLMGIKSQRFLGDGTEFESIRDYVPGFDIRSIDWKSSARHHALHSREYRAERNHQIVLAIDTGHLMIEPIDGMPRLDRAIQSALLLGFASLKNGDRVGLCAFDEHMHRFSQPVGGVRAFAHLQQLATELQYSTSETNFTLSLAELFLQLKRRSLIVLFTDFIDTVTAGLMVENVSRLARRHLVLCATIRDPELQRIAEAAPTTEAAMHRSILATDLIRERARVLQQLRRLGVHVIEAGPAEAPTAVVNRYLELKRREMV
jgi:uncharacterized protein (DUF58 family)